eukprot:14453216-Heterocapsa_arctica.AAC.1
MAERPTLEAPASCTIWTRSPAVGNHNWFRSFGLHMKLTVSTSIGSTKGRTRSSPQPFIMR